MTLLDLQDKKLICWPKYWTYWMEVGAFVASFLG